MPDRTLEQVTQEYQNGCFQLGQKEYQKFTLEKDIELLNQTLRDLNFEAAALKAKEAPKSEAAETGVA